MTTKQSTQPAECRVIIDNQVLGTRQEFTLPVSGEEASDTCMPVADAWRWFLRQDDQDCPLAVAIHQGNHEVVVRWHAVGEPQAAQEEMRAMLDGGWKGGQIS